MYIAKKVKFSSLLVDSWKFLLLTSLWGVLVVYLHDFLGWGLISIPIVPVSTIGITVSIYLGFKSKQSYDRWWEARKIVGGVVNQMRIFSLQVHSLIYTIDSKELDKVTKRELIHKALSWMHSLKSYLRSTSKYSPKGASSLFENRVTPKESLFQLEHYLSTKEILEISRVSNVPVQILIKLAQRIKQLKTEGYLDSYRECEFNKTVAKLYEYQGMCERIKFTPSPILFSFMGRIFTWIFIFLLPLGFVETFEVQGKIYLHNELLQREYMFALVPFSVLISWIFFMLDKISSALEDPFEGGVHDVPLCTLTRCVEIDLLESLNEEKIPKKITPVNDIIN